MKLEQLKKMIREIAKKEMLKEVEINWNAVQNAIINFLKTNTKILDKKVQSKVNEGVSRGSKVNKYETANSIMRDIICVMSEAYSVLSQANSPQSLSRLHIGSRIGL